MKKLERELQKDQTILVLIPSSTYNKEICNIVKQLSDKTILYVTLNKTHQALKELFKSKKIKIDNIFFIDAISKTIRNNPDCPEDCIYTQSPAALTEMSLAIGKLLKLKFDYMVFDSVTNLSVYQKKGPITKFLATTINKIKQTETKAVLYAIPLKEQEALIKQIGTFVDKVK